MKSRSLLPIVIAVFLMTTCGANKAAKDEKQQTNTPSANAALAQGDVFGEWEMVGFVVDTNDNLQIDESERSALKKPSVKDYMKLNRDGSGVFTVAKMQGRYEITDQSSGKKYLTWYDKANGRHRVGTIIKVTRDELHIKEPGGHGLFVWKRL
jgi:hypothetical protein